MYDFRKVPVPQEVLSDAAWVNLQSLTSVEDFVVHVIVILVPYGLLRSFDLWSSFLPFLTFIGFVYAASCV